MTEILQRCAFGHNAGELRWVEHNGQEIAICWRHHEAIHNGAQLRGRTIPAWENLSLVINKEDTHATDTDV